MNTGLFVCGDDVIIGTQGNALPEALVKIEDGPGFAGKGRIAREDPASMFPGAKGIAAEPAPQRSAADLSDQALRNNVLAVSSTESRDNGSPRVSGCAQASAFT